MDKEQLECLFRPYETDEKQFRINGEHIQQIQSVFGQAVIRTALEIPDNKEGTRKRFVEHAWKAYVIAMSAHEGLVMPLSNVVLRTSEFNLHRFYESARASCKTSNEKKPNAANS